MDDFVLGTALDRKGTLADRWQHQLTGHNHDSSAFGFAQALEATQRQDDRIDLGDVETSQSSVHIPANWNNRKIRSVSQQLCLPSQ
jgi:hypothetical protein